MIQVDKEKNGQWFDRLDEMVPERYQTLSRIKIVVQTFPESISRSYELDSYVTGRMKKNLP